MKKTIDFGRDAGTDEILFVRLDAYDRGGFEQRGANGVERLAAVDRTSRTMKDY